MVFSDQKIFDSYLRQQTILLITLLYSIPFPLPINLQSHLHKKLTFHERYEHDWSLVCCWNSFTIAQWKIHQYLDHKLWLLSWGTAYTMRKRENHADLNLFSEPQNRQEMRNEIRVATLKKNDKSLNQSDLMAWKKIEEMSKKLSFFFLTSLRYVELQERKINWMEVYVVCIKFHFILHAKTSPTHQRRESFEIEMHFFSSTATPSRLNLIGIELISFITSQRWCSNTHNAMLDGWFAC